MMTPSHIALLLGFALGAITGSLVSWKICFHLTFASGVDAGVAAHLEGFKKGCKVTADAFHKLADQERRNFCMKLAASSEPVLAAYGRRLAVLHYGCQEDCDKDHSGEIPAQKG